MMIVRRRTGSKLPFLVPSNGSPGGGSSVSLAEVGVFGAWLVGGRDGRMYEDVVLPLLVSPTSVCVATTVTVILPWYHVE